MIFCNFKFTSLARKNNKAAATVRLKICNFSCDKAYILAKTGRENHTLDHGLATNTIDLDFVLPFQLGLCQVGQFSPVLFQMTR